MKAQARTALDIGKLVEILGAAYVNAKEVGLSNIEICSRAGGWAVPRFNTILRRTRYYLRNGEWNIVADPAGLRRRWQYRLVKTLDPAVPWVSNRVGDAETRIMIINAVLKAIATNYDGRSAEGRKVRVMVRALTRLEEDLAEIAV